MRATLFCFITLSLSMRTLAQDYPPNAQPGKCYIKTVSVDVFKDTVIQVQTSPEYRMMTLVPTTYKTVSNNIVAREAYKMQICKPPVFDTIEVEYPQKENKELALTPASFQDATAVFERRPTLRRWDTVPGSGGMKVYHEELGEYDTVKVTKLVADASFKDVSEKTVMGKYKKVIVKTPGSVEEVSFPAETITIQQTLIDKPAYYVETVVPAQYRSLTQHLLVQKGGETIWKEIDCRLTKGYVVLPILYDLNSAALTDLAKKIIDKNLLTLLRDYPDVRVDIRSHTDSRGGFDYNMKLSDDRAKSVKEYLLQNGIAPERMECKGFGYTQLVNNCGVGVNCSEEDHQKNRRTEFKLLTN